MTPSAAPPSAPRPRKRWVVVLTEPQLRVVEFAVFALIDDARQQALREHGYSLAAAKRAHAAIERARPAGKEGGAS